MDALDRAWRRWISLILVAMIVTTAVLGFVVLPVLQGRDQGLDAFTAICRAIGINLAARQAAAPVNPAVQPVSQVSWNPKTFGALLHGDKTSGAKIAEGKCVACHAADGSSADPSIPGLAGQSAFAIYKQLRDYKSDARANDMMSPVAQNLDDAQMADVAAYYSRLVRSDLDPLHPSFEGPEIEALVEQGDSARGVPPCSACHGAMAGGPIETPTLTGQSPQYVTATLKAFAEGQRRNDIYQRMRGIAAKLTPQEMALLGAYYTTPH
jgi:cytochrome c553